MAELMGFRIEFLPHVTRLFYPGEERITGKVNWFRQQLETSGHDLAKTSVLLKGSTKLLAFCWLHPLESRMPGLIQAHIAVDPQITPAEWQSFWPACCRLAQGLTRNPRLRVIIPQGLKLVEFLEQEGLTNTTELTQYQSVLEPLAELPLPGDFKITTLAAAPKLANDWLRVFNLGISAFWNQPLWDNDLLQARLATGSPEAWRLGLAGDEPVGALFYEIIDPEQGLVRINVAATSPAFRNKGYGRLMLKDLLAHLRSKGFKRVYQLADGHNQATALLYKMQGFTPQGVYQVLEGDVAHKHQQVPVAATAEDKPETQEVPQEQKKQQSYGFYPMFHSHVSKKDTE